MPSRKRHKTRYPGVYYVMGISPVGKQEKTFYVTYYKDGKSYEEPVGHQHRDNMTAASAAAERWRRITGKSPTNEEWRKLMRKQKWTFDAIWELYKETYPHHKGRSTDEYRYRNFIKPLVGLKRPDKLTPLDADRLRLKQLKGAAPKSIANTLELLRRLLNFAASRELCNMPSFKVKVPRTDNEKTEDLTPKQFQALMKAIDESEHHDAANMMRLALATGMRRGEMFKLQWDDIDFRKGFITLRQPKGGKTQTIPLSMMARSILKNHPKGSGPYVFPGRGGRQRVDISKAVRSICDTANLPRDFRPLHGLRHVFASALASSGRVDLYTLQRLLTHKTPIMTQRYAHLRDDALRRASNLAGGILFNEN